MSDPTLSFAASRSTYRAGRKWKDFEWSYFNAFIFTMKEHLEKNFNRWDVCQNNFALICAKKSLRKEHSKLPLLKNKFCKLFLFGMPTFHITNSDVTPPKPKMPLFLRDASLGTDMSSDSCCLGANWCVSHVKHSARWNSYWEPSSYQQRIQGLRTYFFYVFFVYTCLT